MALSSARRWFLIERKSFEIVLEGRQDDKVRFTEFRRRSRSLISLNLEEARWFVTSWPSISKEPRVAGRCARYRKGDRCLFLSMHFNDFGWFIKLMEVWKGTARTIDFPEGDVGSGWEKVHVSSEEILKIWPGKVSHQKASERGREACDFSPLPKPSQIHKVVNATKGWGNQGFSIAIVCPCCGDSFEGTLSLKPGLKAAVMATGRSGDGNEGVNEQQAGAGARRSGARSDEVNRIPAVRKSGPASKGKKPTFEIRKGVGPVLGRGKGRLPKKRYVRKDSLNSLQGASSTVFSDPILEELCSIAEYPQASKDLVSFDDFETQTGGMSEEVATALDAFCMKEGGNGFMDREGGSPTELGDIPCAVGSPLAGSEDDRALVIFEPRSVVSHDTLDAVLVDSRLPADLTAEEASKRVLAEVMDFSKILDLSFDGQEDRAANLFSSIENRRLKEFQELEKKSATPVSRELKRLESGVNYESSARKGTARGSGKRQDEKG